MSTRPNTGSTSPAPAGRGDVARGVVRQSRWLAVSSVLVGVLNYGYSLAMTRLLAPALFADFAAAQSLLLICGTLATSAVPWVITRVLADPAHDERQRHEVVWFSLVVNAAQGLIAAALITALGSRFLTGGSLVAVALGSIAIFLTTTPGGWLQGTAQFGRLAFFRVLEVVVKLGVGVALVAAGGSDSSAITGIVVGAATVVAAGLVLMRADVRRVPSALRRAHLWRAGLGNVGVQGLVAVIASADVVLVATLSGGSAASGSYQASIVLARIPVFLAGALGIAAFPALVSRTAAADHVRGATMSAFAVLAGACATILITAPTHLLGTLFGSGYGQVGDLLPWCAVTGLLMGAINLATTYYQAVAAYARAIRVLAVAVGAHVSAMAIGWAVDGVHGVAVTSSVVPFVVTVILLRLPEGRLPKAHAVRPIMLGCAASAGTVLLLLATRSVWPLWLVVAMTVGAVALYRALRTSPTSVSAS